MGGYSLFPPVKTKPSFGDMNCIRELSAVLSRPSIFVHSCTFGYLKHGLLVPSNKLMSIMDRSIESRTHRLGKKSPCIRMQEGLRGQARKDRAKISLHTLVYMAAPGESIGGNLIFGL
jgi:hypothetical protein